MPWVRSFAQVELSDCSQEDMYQYSITMSWPLVIISLAVEK